jgi:serine/threonine-protein kinase HipA
VTDALDVYLYGALAATLDYRGPSDYALSYRREWQETAAAVPVSLSLPLAQQEHRGRSVFDFVDNLLPDSAGLREEWARQSALPDAEAFGLLSVRGADVAGALEFYPAGETARSTGSLRPISDSEIAARIRAIRENRPIPASEGAEPGQFSLGGAQGKFALAYREGRWFEPTGVSPSTHIFKPQVTGLLDAEIVEHVTMTALSILGLPAAATTMAEFAGEHSLQITRFDRFDLDGVTSRIHQEDLTQTLGVPRLRKYERDGGPGYRQILAILDRIPDPDAAATAKTRFVRSLIFSWFVLNTDAHAKNYSIQLIPGAVELAPLYDVSSFLPYLNPHDEGQRGMRRAFDGTRLSMRVADSFEAGSMGAFEWQAVARDARVDPRATLAWARDLVAIAPAVFDAVVRSMADKFQTDAVELLLERIAVRAVQIERLLASTL